MNATVDSIIKYECGELGARETVELFASLVADGSAWTLQGHYGRTAARLIEAGILDRKGVIDWNTFDTLVTEAE